MTRAVFIFALIADLIVLASFVELMWRAFG